MRNNRRLQPLHTSAVLTCLIFFNLPLDAMAGADFDAGLRLFKAKRYAEAARMFDRAVADAPWESSPLYYAALSYHYAGDFKQAAAKYAGLVQKFPGTIACSNAEAALRVVDPGYFKRKESSVAAGAAAGGASPAAALPGSAAADTGAANQGGVEGESQTRVYFTKQGDDKFVDVKVGGRAIRVVLNEHAEETAFSSGQLSALGVRVTGKEARVDLQLGGVVRKNFPVKVDDNVGANPKLGNSFLNAFAYDIDNAANFIDLRRKGTSSASSTAAGGGNQLAFQKEGKDIIVSVQVNGRNTPMIFDPSASGVVISAKTAKSLGLRVDEAEEAYRNPAEGPQRGEPGWVPPEDRPSGPKYLTVQRMRLGPVDRSNIQVQINEKESRYPKLGQDFLNAGWKFEIDYQANVIKFRH